MKYKVRSYFQIDPQSKGEWKDLKEFSTYEEAVCFVQEKEKKSWAQFYIYEYKPTWVLVGDIV